MSTPFKQFKIKTLKNTAVRAEYEALGPEYEMIKTIIKARSKRGWSQAKLATAIGSRQPVISRLERGDGNPSLKTLGRIAKALDLSLKVSMR
jgi:ribosome-binding protein aMBF1 (putative translation factor)